MNFGLNNRVALVTGGSKGIGKSIATSLAKEGATVVICARGANELDALREEIMQFGGKSLVFSVDATDDNAVKELIAAACETCGGIDILVNNVGGAQKFGGFLELDNRDWLDAFNLNVMTVVNFTRHSLPLLRQSRDARIINISSISGVQPGSYNPHYALTKAAVINLSKYLANQLASEKILVNVVCAGPVYSHSWDRNIHRISAVRNISFEEASYQVDAEETAKIPLKRIGRGSDIGDFVAFLASDKAGWITGSCFHINGGKLSSII